MTASARKIRRRSEAESGDAREALMQYLAEIFPGQSRGALAGVADHQLAFLWEKGFKLVPLKITDLDS